MSSAIDLAVRPANPSESESDEHSYQESSKVQEDPYEESDDETLSDEMAQAMRDALGEPSAPADWSTPDPDHDPVFGSGGAIGDTDPMEIILDAE
jgi:hypothetical protein